MVLTVGGSQLFPTPMQGVVKDSEYGRRVRRTSVLPELADFLINRIAELTPSAWARLKLLFIVESTNNPAGRLRDGTSMRAMYFHGFLLEGE